MKRTIRTKNEIIVYDDYAAMNLYDVHGNIVGVAKIDIDDVNRVHFYKWYLGKNGYVYTRVTSQMLHRLVMNAPKEKQVDHINHNTLDNRKANLRLCTNQENNCNRKVSKGVSYNKKLKLWQAYTHRNYKKIHIGWYKTEEEAIQAKNIKVTE